MLRSLVILGPGASVVLLGSIPTDARNIPPLCSGSQAWKTQRILEVTDAASCFVSAES